MFNSRIDGGKIDFELSRVLYGLDASEEDTFEMQVRLLSTDYVKVVIRKKED